MVNWHVCMKLLYLENLCKTAVYANDCNKIHGKRKRFRAGYKAPVNHQIWIAPRKLLLPRRKLHECQYFREIFFLIDIKKSV